MHMQVLSNLNIPAPSESIQVSTQEGKGIVCISDYLCHRPGHQDQNQTNVVGDLGGRWNE